jgi:hypothetical protein
MSRWTDKIWTQNIYFFEIVELKWSVNGQKIYKFKVFIHVEDLETYWKIYKWLSNNLETKNVNFLWAPSLFINQHDTIIKISSLQCESRDLKKLFWWYQSPSNHTSHLWDLVSTNSIYGPVKDESAKEFKIWKW